MPATFGDVARKVHLQAAAVPYPLCRQFVLDSYKEACDGRQWGFLRKDVFFSTLALRSVTATATQGNATLTSAALFLATDVGRQFRVGALGPIYTIASFTSTSSVTLDQPWQQTGGAVTGSIFDAYLTLPEDFGGWRTLVNPSFNRPMPWWLTDEWLNAIDANRQQSDTTARLVASRTVTTAGRVQYEWWPHITGVATYPASYYKRPDDFGDDELLPGLLATRDNVLLRGALAKCALWPGTAAQRNPYFQMSLADTLETRWREDLERMAVRDDDQFAQMMEPVNYDWVTQGWPGSWSDHYLRSSDAPASALWGGFYSS